MILCERARVCSTTTTTTIIEIDYSASKQSIIKLTNNYTWGFKLKQKTKTKKESNFKILLLVTLLQTSDIKQNKTKQKKTY